jgi:tetratricopeptide (TPR) repeat protein
MHESHVIPSSSSRNELAGSAIGARFRRVLRHARTPRSSPAVFWKNVKYAFAPQRPRPPEDPGAWNELGRGWAARKRYVEAPACYDHGLAIRGDIPQIWNDRGNALRNLDRLDEAEESVREALRLKPDFVSTQNTNVSGSAI